MIQDQEVESKSLQQYWALLKRRRYLFLPPAIVIALASVLYALSLPVIYSSQATILIEDQEIPEDIVGATITSYASQQIQLISQRVLTVENIQEIVEKYDVYGPPDPVEPLPAATQAIWFRADMDLELVAAEVVDPRGRASEAAVAFILSFQSTDPEVAQNVVEELVALFLNENRRSGASKTMGVSALLATAVESANEELLIAEADLAEFKANNEGALPELYQFNFDVISRTQQQLSDVTLRIQELEQRKLQLSAQLAALSPSAMVTLPSGETVVGDRERLNAALIEHQRKTSIYEPDHPDIVRLKREIESLQKTVGGIETADWLSSQLRLERERLNRLLDRYSTDHPDVQAAKSSIANLESQMAAADQQGPRQVGIPDNPAYVMINTQLQSADLEIRSLLEKRMLLESIIAKHEALIKQAPNIEVQYESLLRAYENARTKYVDLQAKLRAAQVAANVEQEISGQRFKLIEPPALPIAPLEGNRAAIILLGLVLSTGVGAGVVALAESNDHSIRGAKRLESIAGAPPLAVIPYLVNDADIEQARTKRSLRVGALILVSAMTIVYVIYVN